MLSKETLIVTRANVRKDPANTGYAFAYSEVLEADVFVPPPMAVKLGLHHKAGELLEGGSFTGGVVGLQNGTYRLMSVLSPVTPLGEIPQVLIAPEEDLPAPANADLQALSDGIDACWKAHEACAAALDNVDTLFAALNKKAVDAGAPAS